MVDVEGIAIQPPLTTHPLHKMITFDLRTMMTAISTGTHGAEAWQVVEFRTTQRFQIDVGNPPGFACPITQDSIGARLRAGCKNRQYADVSAQVWAKAQTVGNEGNPYVDPSSRTILVPDEEGWYTVFWRQPSTAKILPNPLPNTPYLRGMSSSSSSVS